MGIRDWLCTNLVLFFYQFQSRVYTSVGLKKELLTLVLRLKIFLVGFLSVNVNLVFQIYNQHVILVLEFFSN